MASKISSAEPLCLASASPRRRRLLERLGIPLAVRPVAVDERALPGEAPDAYLARVVADKLAGADLAGAAAALVADTVVLLDGRILGKPASDAEAREMLRALAGREHCVATRFAIATGAGEQAAETVRTAVWFRALDEAQIARYVATGETRDKAGAYAIQGVGSMLVERIDGDYANVVGLPVCRVVQALERLELLSACPPE